MEGYIAIQRIADGETVTATKGIYEGARIYRKGDEVYIIKAGASSPVKSIDLTSFLVDDFEIVKVVDFEEAVVNMLNGLCAERYDNGRTLRFADNQFMTLNDEGIFVPTTITPTDYEQTWRIFKP